MSRAKKRIKKEAVPGGETAPNHVKAVSSYDKELSQPSAKLGNRKENPVSKVKIGEHESVTDSENNKENTMKKYTVELQLSDNETSDIGTEYSPKAIVTRVLISTDCLYEARELYNLCDALAMGIKHPAPCPDWLLESTLLRLRIASLIQKSYYYKSSIPGSPIKQTGGANNWPV